MFEKVCKILGEELGLDPNSIKPEHEVIKDLGADSLAILDLMSALEDEYDLTVPEEGWEQLKTVQDIVDMLNNI